METLPRLSLDHLQQRLPLLMPVSAWVAGITLSRSELLPINAALFTWALLFLFLFLIKRRGIALLLLVAALWGSSDLLMDAKQIQVDQGWLNTTVVSTATIQRVEQHKAYRRILLTQIIRDDGQHLGGKALLYDYRSHGKTGQDELHAGDRIQFTARWHQPRNKHNPGGFDYQAWCFDHHIALLGSLHGQTQLLSRSSSALQQGRQRLISVLDHLPDATGGVLRALLLADRSRLSTDVSNAFSATGTAHLLAISGMHVGLAAAWGMGLFWWLMTRRESWIVRLPVRSLALLAGLLTAVAYATVAGWPLPAQRAGLMLAAAVLAYALSARHESINILLAALGLILLFDPSAVTTLSLWLSFIASAALLIWAGNRKKSNESITKRQQFMAASGALFRVSCIATLATLPIIITVFGRLPVYSIPANLLLVPLYGLWVMPLALLGELAAFLHLTGLASLLMQTAALGVEAGIGLLHQILNWPAASLWATTPPSWSSLLYAVALIYSSWLWTRQRYRPALACALLTIALYAAFVLDERSVQTPQWIVWDVGQGAASTLILPATNQADRVIVVDVPGHQSSRFNGGTTVATGLRNLGLTHVDILLLSHAQSDHMGGALSLLESVNSIAEIWLPDVPVVRNDKRIRTLLVLAERRGTRIRWMVRGDQINLMMTNKIPSPHSTRIHVLWPPRDYKPGNDNNTSMVISIAWDGQSKLFLPGDIEAGGEAQLNTTTISPGSVMLMPHHGSNTSSTIALLKSIHPALAIAQTGAHNRYGFPRERVLNRYQSLSIPVLNSADGAISVTWKGQPPMARRFIEPASPRRALATRWTHASDSPW